jgi:hypothetical protein
VETNRGATELLLKAEDHIRRLSHTALMTAYRFDLTWKKLDAHSRKLLIASCNPSSTEVRRLNQTSDGGPFKKPQYPVYSTKSR